MSMSFSASEVFTVGMEVELSGRAFYDAAAAHCEAAGVKAVLTNLRDQEAAHYRTFSEMREALSGEAKAQTVYDPDGQMGAYLKALADSRVFTSKTQAAQVAERCKTAAEVLETALRFEKDSVLMFQAMKDVTREDWGRDKIDGLISAEKGHIRDLCAALAGVKGESP